MTRENRKSNISLRSKDCQKAEKQQRDLCTQREDATPQISGVADGSRHSSSPQVSRTRMLRLGHGAPEETERRLVEDPWSYRVAPATLA